MIWTDRFAQAGPFLYIYNTSAVPKLFIYTFPILRISFFNIPKPFICVSESSPTPVPPMSHSPFALLRFWPEAHPKLNRTEWVEVGGRGGWGWWEGGRRWEWGRSWGVCGVKVADSAVRRGSNSVSAGRHPSQRSKKRRFSASDNQCFTKNFQFSWKKVSEKFGNRK